MYDQLHNRYLINSPSDDCGQAYLIFVQNFNIFPITLTTWFFQYPLKILLKKGNLVQEVKWCYLITRFTTRWHQNNRENEFSGAEEVLIFTTDTITLTQWPFSDTKIFGIETLLKNSKITLFYRSLLPLTFGSNPEVSAYSTVSVQFLHDCTTKWPMTSLFAVHMTK